MPERAMEETAAAVKRPTRIPEPAPHAPMRAPAPAWDAAGAHVPGAPSAVLAIQRAAGNQAVMRMLDVQRPGHPLAGPPTAVQRSSEVELDDEDVQRVAAALHEPSDDAIRSAAAEGVRTPATTLPHLDRIQASFGRHSIAHVQAHVGPEAARASRAMNALAYASGSHVVFGTTPDLRTAAHEAAHIVQQQAGVQLSGGIGRAGDPYERHADAVADTVVAGRSAERILVRLPILQLSGTESDLLDSAVQDQANTFPGVGDAVAQRYVRQAVRSRTEHLTMIAPIQRLLILYTKADKGEADADPNDWMNQVVSDVLHTRSGISHKNKTTVDGFKDGAKTGVYKHFIPYNRIFRALKEHMIGETRKDVYKKLRWYLEVLRIEIDSENPIASRFEFDVWIAKAVESICDWPFNLFHGKSYGDKRGQATDEPKSPSPELTERLAQAGATLNVLLDVEIPHANYDASSGEEDAYDSEEDEGLPDPETHKSQKTEGGKKDVLMHDSGEGDATGRATAKAKRKFRTKYYGNN